MSDTSTLEEDSFSTEQDRRAEAFTSMIKELNQTLIEYIRQNQVTSVNWGKEPRYLAGLAQIAANSLMRIEDPSVNVYDRRLGGSQESDAAQASVAFSSFTDAVCDALQFEYSPRGQENKNRFRIALIKEMALARIVLGRKQSKLSENMPADTASTVSKGTRTKIRTTLRALAAFLTGAPHNRR